MLRLKNEHNELFFDKCYSKGYEPYPNHKLELMISIFQENGLKKEYLDEDFLSSEFIYENYKLQIFCGQGCINRISKLVNNNWVQFIQV